MLDSDPVRWRELARRVQAADPGSEDEFARVFYPHVMAMALGRLRELEEAREAAQDALLGVIRALRDGRLREPGRLPAFVSGTARNRINTHIQKLIQRQGTLSLDGNGNLASDLAEFVREPAIEEEERRALVRRALRKLKPVDRKILTLTLAEGLNPREIAVELDMKPEDVRNHKSRALNIVQERIRKMIRKGGTSYR
jgi:RNA polymerase sigma-70 factor, ECF subfamily